jgi:hypothetical protein
MGQLEKKVIHTDMVPLKQGSHIGQLAIFYPFHVCFVRNFLHNKRKLYVNTGKSEKVTGSEDIFLG